MWVRPWRNVLEMVENHRNEFLKWRKRLEIGWNRAFWIFVPIFPFKKWSIFLQMPISPRISNQIQRLTTQNVRSSFLCRPSGGFPQYIPYFIYFSTKMWKNPKMQNFCSIFPNFFTIQPRACDIPKCSSILHLISSQSAKRSVRKKFLILR